MLGWRDPRRPLLQRPGNDMQQGGAGGKSEEDRLAHFDLASGATEDQERDQECEMLGEPDQEGGPEHGRGY